MKEFYKYTEQIDELTKIERPTKEDVQKILGIIGDDDDLAIYFYRGNTNGEWVTLLNEVGEFDELADPEKINAILPRMKAHYLVEAAKQKTKEVAGIISRIDVKDIIIQSILLDTLLKNPLEVIEEGVDIIKRYLGEEKDYSDWYMAGERSAEFMNAIAEKYPDKTFEIAEALLKVQKPEEESYLDKIKSRFEEHDYEDLMFKHYKKVWELYPLRSTKFLANLFNSYLEELPADDYDLVSGFNVSIERLDQIRERYHRTIVKIIIQGICEAGKEVIEKQPEKIGELLDYFESLKKVIFERIEIYLLRFVPDNTQSDRINSIINNKKYLDDYYWWYEYRLLLRDKFDNVSQQARKVFENWVKAQKLDDEDKKGISDWFKKRENRDATAKDFETIENSRKAGELYLVRKEFSELYNECKEKSGASDEEIAPKPRIGEATAISSMEDSPLSVEKMLKMEPRAVIEYILDPSKWVIDKKQDHPFHTPEESLAATFGNVVKQRIENYIEIDINELTKLKSEFLRNYAIGVRDVTNQTDEIINKIINQLHSVVKQKKDESNYQDYIDNMLSVVGQLFNDESLREKVIKANKEVIWEIVEPLVSYNDGREINDNVYRDPHSACINCIPGRSFEFVIRFGLVCKNADEKDYLQSWSGKMREILTKVIKVIKDPRIRCALGVWFPQLHWLEEGLVVENVDKIFNHSDDKEWDVTWGSYVKWARAYKNTFMFLAEQGKYECAIERIRSDSTGDEYNEPEKRLVEHLIVAYYNGWIKWDCSLLNKFFEKAPAKLRGKAADFMRTGFKSTKEKDDKKYTNAVIERVKKYWEKRLEVIESNPEMNTEEAVEFIDWVKNTLLEPKETLQLLSKTLDLTKGKLSKNSDESILVKSVCKIGEGNELLALKCINKMMQGKPEWISFSDYEGYLKKFLDHILSLSSDATDIIEIRKEAKELVNAYGRRQIDELRSYYDELSKRLEKR